MSATHRKSTPPSSTSVMPWKSSKTSSIGSIRSMAPCWSLIWSCAASVSPLVSHSCSRHRHITVQTRDPLRVDVAAGRSGRSGADRRSSSAPSSRGGSCSEDASQSPEPVLGDPVSRRSGLNRVGGKRKAGPVEIPLRRCGVVKVGRPECVDERGM